MTASRDTGTQHKLRMPPELKEKLFESAKDMNRSLNAEIVARLEESFVDKYKESDLNMLATGFSFGLYQRYQLQLEELQAELNKETNSNRIKILESEIQRMEILSKEMKAITEKMNKKNRD